MSRMSEERLREIVTEVCCNTTELIHALRAERQALEADDLIAKLAEAEAKIAALFGTIREVRPGIAFPELQLPAVANELLEKARDWDDHLPRCLAIAEQHVRERDALKARVKELEEKCSK